MTIVGNVHTLFGIHPIQIKNLSYMYRYQALSENFFSLENAKLTADASCDLVAVFNEFLLFVKQKLTEDNFCVTFDKFLDTAVLSGRKFEAYEIFKVLNAAVARYAFYQNFEIKLVRESPPNKYDVLKSLHPEVFAKLGVERTVKIEELLKNFKPIAAKKRII